MALRNESTTKATAMGTIAIKVTRKRYVGNEPRPISEAASDDIKSYYFHRERKWRKKGTLYSVIAPDEGDVMPPDLGPASDRLHGIWDKWDDLSWHRCPRRFKRW